MNVGATELATAGSGPILVVGAGAAGIACALVCAQAGRETLLVERAAQIGGTVANALIHTIGGLFDDAGEPLNPGLPTTLTERLLSADPHTRKRRMGRVQVLNCDPGVYRRVVIDWVAAQPTLECLTDTEIEAIDCQVGQVQRVRLRNRSRPLELHPAAVVDTTGDALVVRQLDPTLVEPGEALAGLVLVLQGVAPDALQFPRGVAVARAIRSAAAAGELPEACATLWPDTGIAPDQAYLKFNLQGDAFDPRHLRQVADTLLAWLHGLPGLAEARIKHIGALGVRDGGRIRSEYRLTEADLLAARRFPDAVCQGCWPIEHWHPRQGIQMHYLPSGTRYDIPLRALKVRGMTNLYAAGKCLGAEPRAQASARVAGTCWGMGAGLGQVLVGSVSRQAGLSAQ